MSVCDVGSGIYAATLVIAALLERERTGRGRRPSPRHRAVRLEFCEGFLIAPELAADPRYATNVDRLHHRRSVDEHVTRAFSGLTSAEAAACLDELGIAYGWVNDMSSLAAQWSRASAACFETSARLRAAS